MNRENWSEWVVGLVTLAAIVCFVWATLKDI
jgi:hypothetical protein